MRMIEVSVKLLNSILSSGTTHNFLVEKGIEENETIIDIKFMNHHNSVIVYIDKEFPEISSFICKNLEKEELMKE